MGVTKKLIHEGNGTDKPKAGDTITSMTEPQFCMKSLLIHYMLVLVEYTGVLYDENATDNKGKQYVMRV